MIRFAITIASVEILLTLGASLWVTLSDAKEPYVTREEFGILGIPVEQVTAERKSRFGSLYSYDTKSVVMEGGPSLLVSVIVNASREEFTGRKSMERIAKVPEGDEPPVIVDESWPWEPGYALRATGRSAVRSEVVRLHGKDLLVLKAVWKIPAERSGAQAVSRCEHFVRLLQDHMVQKLGWRD